jgi:hypothetical protein
MKYRVIVYFVAIVLISLIIHVSMKKPTSYEEFFILFEEIIKVFSPAGVFLLGFLGLSQWKKELTYKKQNKLAEEIALSLLDFKNAMHGIRTNWPISWSTDFVFDEGIAEKKSLTKPVTTSLSFIFTENNHKNLASRVDLADRKREELEQNLRIASLLWKNPEIEKVGHGLFNLYYDIINAIYRIRFSQSFDKWSFEGEEIENNPDLSIIFHFNFRTKNKTADELNLVYREKLDTFSDDILEKISEYLF